MPDVPHWNDRVRPAVDALVQFVGGDLEHCKPSAEIPRTTLLAAAYLARTRRLVLAALALYDAAMPDVIGTPLRVLFETWVTGMWVFYERDDADERLGADYITTMNRHNEAAGLGLDPLPPVEDVSTVPDVRSRTVIVSRHLEAEGDTGASSLPWAYDLIYRGESHAAVHAGFASVVGHFYFHAGETDVAGVKPVRTEASDGASRVVFAATLLAMLARRVFEAFGLDPTQIDQVGAPIFDMANQLNDHVVSGLE